MTLKDNVNRLCSGLALGLLMTTLCLSAAVAQETSEQDDPSNPWHLDVEALTDVPVHIGARVALEGPWRLRGALALGSLPEAYVDLINATSTSLDFYNQETADLIALVLKRSLVVRASLAWRPWETRGFYVEGGYSYVGLGGGASGQEVLAALTGQELARASADRNYDINSTLHLLNLDVGWRWWLTDALSLRAAAGFIATVAANTQVKADFEPTNAQLNANFERGVADFLDDTYTSYVFSPTLTVAIGYRFF